MIHSDDVLSSDRLVPDQKHLLILIVKWTTSKDLQDKLKSLLRFGFSSPFQRKIVELIQALMIE